MLKRKKDNDDDSKEVIDGVAGEGNLFHRPWLIATLAMVLSLLAGFTFLLLLRDSALQDQQIERAARSAAVQHAANIEKLLIDYRQRLQAAATSPLALSAIASGSSEDLALVEKAMLDYFPGVTSLRVVAIGELGTATLERGKTGLRNNIELDMLRRASEGESTRPESYSHEGRWLTSLAEAIQHPRQPDRRAVILATLDNQVLSDSLAAMGTELGRSALIQIYRGGNVTNENEIAAAGTGAAEKYIADAELNDNNWRVTFTPSAQMLSLYRVSSTVPVVILALLVLIVVGAMVWLLLAIQRDVAAEVQRVIDTAERKAKLTLQLPDLVPLARLLRKALQRSAAQPGTAARKAAEAPEKAPARVPDTSDGTGIEVVEEDEMPAPPAAIPDHIFRAYDIRGIVESELSEDFVATLGKALGTLADRQGQQALVVGCDGRLSSSSIKNTLVKGLLDSGRDVIDIGLVPTPVLYYATNTLSTQSGVMVTASHNPAEYNGFKITLDGKPLSGEGLQELKQVMQDGEFSRGAGRLAKQDVRSDYVDAIVGDIAITNPLKIVVDAGNGAAGDVAPRVIEGLGCEVVKLFCEIDGSFPNHHPDPGVDDNLADLRAKVVEEGADFGVAFDGDGDRLTIVTGNGEIVRNDTLLMLFAQDVVSRNPGADVVFDVKCSQHLTQLVSRHGGRPILARTGHAFMREKVQETGALLGGEFSGHLYFGERWFGFDDAAYATARLAEIISGTGIDLPSLLEEFPQTENTPEIKIPVSESDKFDIIGRLSESSDFSPGKVTTLDGVRVDYNDGWGLVRASNTTPALTARFEARDTDALERIKRQFREQILAAAPELELGF